MLCAIIAVLLCVCVCVCVDLHLQLEASTVSVLEAALDALDLLLCDTQRETGRTN